MADDHDEQKNGGVRDTKHFFVIFVSFHESKLQIDHGPNETTENVSVSQTCKGSIYTQKHRRTKWNQSIDEDASQTDFELFSISQKGHRVQQGNHHDWTSENLVREMSSIQHKTPRFDLITNRTNAVCDALANKAPTKQLRCVMLVPNDILLLRANQKKSAYPKCKTEDTANSKEAIYSHGRPLQGEILILLPSHGGRRINLMRNISWHYSSKSDI